MKKIALLCSCATLIAAPVFGGPAQRGVKTNTEVGSRRGAGFGNVYGFNVAPTSDGKIRVAEIGLRQPGAAQVGISENSTAVTELLDRHGYSIYGVGHAAYITSMAVQTPPSHLFCTMPRDGRD